MKSVLRGLLAALCSSVGMFASAQTAVLLKDINTTTVGIPSTPSKGVWMGSYYYFAATNGINGSELWKTDGSTGNTVMVKDINAGNGSSTPNNFAVMGSTLIFSADDGVNGRELWKTDGTTAGTVMIKDMRPGAGLGSGPSDIFAISATTVLFTANDPIYGDELYKTDGTAAGTAMVKEINVGSMGAGFNRVSGTGTKIYFAANNGSSQFGNYELFKSDGTVAGTGLVKEINPDLNTASMNGGTLVWGEKLIFAANNGTNGLELWISDGTNAGTFMVKDINTSGDSNPQQFCVMNGKVYFQATNASGTELWMTDGTNAGTVIVKDINAGAGSSSPLNLTAVGNTLYFRATDGSTGNELWKSDGTAGNAVLVKDIYSGTSGSNPTQMVAMGSTLYFQANDNINGAELWKSDGTAGGTVLVKDIFSGATASGLTNMVTNGSILLFSADNGTNGLELWKSDGSAANTVLVKNINPEVGAAGIINLTAVGSKVVFGANDGVNGLEVWGTDGTSAGTVLLKDINTNANTGSSPGRFGLFNGNAYFSANSGTGAGGTGAELYKTDGTVAGTVMVKDINNGTSGSSPKNFVEHNGALYFSASEAATGAELYKTDGTAGGTVLVKDIVSGTGGSTPGGSTTNETNMISTGSMLMFVALNQNSGQETGWDFYGSTGAIGNGGLIKDINTSSFGANGNPNNFVYPGTGSYAWFVATNGINGTELWKSDGTNANTVMIKDINPGADDTYFTKMKVLNGKAYFGAYSPTSGNELWVTDGTSAGTVVLKDINPGINSSDPQDLTVCGNYIYFSATDGTNGRELWRTDGTAANTIMVSNIVAGSGSSNPANFFYHPVLQSVFFSAYTPANGVELWEYDGTTSRLYTEVVAGAGSSNPGPIMLAGNNLVFVGTNGSNGLELYGVETYNSWAGPTNTNWNNAANWKKGLVPGTTESALLPATGVTNEATLNVNATVVRLEVEAGRVLTLGAGNTLNVTDLVFHEGTLKGTGTLANADFINNGIVAPGNSPGILNITGNYTNNGTLQIELGGTTVGTQYDRLAVTGTATLGGTLAISIYNGVQLSSGQTYTILTSGGARTGTFATVTWPAGVTGTVTYNANSVVLTITSALPLTLVNFTGNASGSQVDLNWKTANEQSTASFEVERSNDGTRFTSIGSLRAIGDGNNFYTKVDENPLNGNNYYRLKMIDIDGKFTYSNTVLVKFAGGKGLKLSPVPATNKLTITLTDLTFTGQRARIYNAAGAFVSEIILYPTTPLDISTWARGVYNIKTEKETYRFVKQ